MQFIGVNCHEIEGNLEQNAARATVFYLDASTHNTFIVSSIERALALLSTLLATGLRLELNLRYELIYVRVLWIRH